VLTNIDICGALKPNLHFMLTELQVFKHPHRQGILNRGLSLSICSVYGCIFLLAVEMEVLIPTVNYNKLFIFCRNDIIQELVAEDEFFFFFYRCGWRWK